jgi:hypothetical protein
VWNVESSGGRINADDLVGGRLAEWSWDGVHGDMVCDIRDEVVL